VIGDPGKSLAAKDFRSDGAGVLSLIRAHTLAWKLLNPLLVADLQLIYARMGGPHFHPIRPSSQDKEFRMQPIKLKRLVFSVFMLIFLSSPAVADQVLDWNATAFQVFSAAGCRRRPDRGDTWR